MKADKFNSGQPSKPPHKVTNALNSVHPLQTMDMDDNVSMNDEPNDHDVHPDVPNGRQVAQDQRHGLRESRKQQLPPLPGLQLSKMRK